MCLLVPAVPPKVDEAFKAFRYVPYTALTLPARQRAARGEEDFIINAQGGITAKGLDRRSERHINVMDWLTSAKAAEDRTRRHHGDERADALMAHHSIVQSLSTTHGWPIAVEYDIQQRELVAENPAHDFCTLDTASLTIIATRRVPASCTNHLPSSLKRSASSEPPLSSPRKKHRSYCFRCGLPGHLPADCKSDSTTAGKPTAAFARGAKSRHALAAPDGRQFCFSWARSSSCSYSSACTHFHGCSICGDHSHGAGSCKSCA
jgi:hypothetical protein